jgi:uncharacterized heparinase superfamily protein
VREITHHHVRPTPRGSIERATRLAHTVRFLRPEQIYSRIIRGFRRPHVSQAPAPRLRQSSGPWRPPIEKSRSLLAGEQARFLNVKASLTGTSVWNDTSKAKLWLYNLHYFDDLIGPPAFAEESDRQRRLLSRWIAENPIGHGNGWEPYPASLRIVNCVKWLIAGSPPVDGLHDSLALQIRWLMEKIEWHLLGNHLIANAKALVFAGLYFDGPEAQQWLQRGLEIYQRELPEQILADGAHFELSPMYHATILEDLLDLLNIAHRYNQLAVPPLNDLISIAARMRSWLAAMTHPDGGLSFFNDATFGIAPSRAELEAYSARLGLPAVAEPGDGVHHLANSGYVRVQRGLATAIFDVAEIGPDYIPGHAHADTLSFELSIGLKRVVVNSGTSTYVLGPQREGERATRAHSTLEVEGRDSSEVWGAFRVGRRARIRDIAINETSDAITVRASHDGYRKQFGGPIHTRCWRIEATSLTVSDALEAQRRHAAIARYFLAPGIQITPSGPNFMLHAPDVSLTARAATGLAVKDSTWHCGFGDSRPNRVLEAAMQGNHLECRFNWA